MKKTFLATIMLLFLFTGIAFGDTASDAMKKGFEAYNKEDYSTAASWFSKASEHGDAEAQEMLGGLYFDGKGVPQNFTEAAKWYRKAAEQGNAPCQGLLGAMYFDGKGVPQNFTEAAKWYRKAAEQGIGPCQSLLGAMYNLGIGVPQNHKQAYIWLSIAAANLEPGDVREQAISMRDHVAQKLTSSQLEQAQKIASEWKPKKEANK